ncbi:MAG TPA: hypothetical protein DDW27_18990 [Bacteroidales bacterium]|nr:hypothetical protein [Bacteroidales bacterium]
MHGCQAQVWVHA